MTRFHRNIKGRHTAPCRLGFLQFIIEGLPCALTAVQRQLHASGTIGPIEMVSYLTRLSHALATSMIADGRPVTLKVVGEGGTLSSRQAESIGLITTELVMNSLKHAFPRADTKGQIIITYEINGTDWELSVADNGVGKQASLPNRKPGLAPGSSKHLRKVSTPKSKLCQELRVRLYRSLTRRSQRPIAGPHE